MIKIRYIFCLMILFPLISNGSFPIQNYETQTNSIKENNPITNLIENDKSKSSSTFAIVSLISGVLSILTIATFAAGWFALLSIIFGILGLKRKGRGMAIAGLCLGLLTYAIYAMIFLDFLVTLANS